jgi:lipopolysaccharide export LptBFGC system permease protein LptF
MALNLADVKDEGQLEKKPKDMTIQELEGEIDRLKKEGIDPTPLITEINKKISLAFSCFVFILLGCPLAIITRRREKSINFSIAFLIVGIYYLLLMGSEALSLQGYLDPKIAMWLPNIILGAIGTILTFRICAY